MAQKIVVDQEKCIGCGACASTCEGSFEMRDGKAFAVKADVEELTCEKEAESVCPVDAISVI
ncbi:ferredoxin [Candidatus Pacearchaeota archaeon]|nr:ferredoxin [Candidatus Pacearchaeota archaeon]